ncbi:MAG: hypothetical protein ABF830_03825, partial [Liquorilactobacillus satsumensis]
AVEGKRGSECLLKPVSNIDFNPDSFCPPLTIIFFIVYKSPLKYQTKGLIHLLSHSLQTGDTKSASSNTTRSPQSFQSKKLKLRKIFPNIHQKKQLYYNANLNLVVFLQLYNGGRFKDHLPVIPSA